LVAVTDAAPSYTFDDGQPENPAAADSSWTGATPPAYTFDDGQPENVPAITVGREAGIGGRSLIEGVGQLEDTPMAIAHAIDAGVVWAGKKAGLISPDYQLPDQNQAVAQFKQDHPTLAAIAASAPTMGFANPFRSSATEGAQAVANAAGLPTAATPGERVYAAGVRAAPSALFTPEAPIAGALSGMLSGGASQTAAEMGASPAVQTGVGLAAGLTPAGIGAGVRGLARGPSAAGMAARMADADAAGTSLTVGQATGNPAIQKMESVSKSMWGGGPLQRAADTQAENLGTSVDNIATKLKGSTPDADVSKAGTGEVIQQGLMQTKTDMRAAENAAYDKVDQLVPPTTNVDISKTQQLLDTLATPSPGAESLTSPLLARVRDDVAAAAPDGTMPYANVVALRTKIGNRLNPMAQDQEEQGALKQVYKALSADRDASASAVSPEASQAVTDASALYKQNSDTRNFIGTIIGKTVGKTPEQVYQAATGSLNNGPTIISRVMQNLNPDQQNLVRAGIMKRWASAIPSKGGEDVFDPTSFLTKWNGATTETKNALFGNSGTVGQWRKDLDSFVGTLKTLQKSKALPNPSGTAEKGGHVAQVLHTLMEIGAGAVGGHAAAGAAGLVGGVLHAAAGAGVAVGLNNVLARSLTSPTVVRWLATTSKLPAAAKATAVTQLGRMKNNPDAQALYQALQGQ
jgi:hypothetical protein